MRVGIVGGGIGGLVTAIGLQRAGATVDGFERVHELRALGSGLSVFGNGFAALEAVGAGAAVRAVAGDAVTTLRAGQRTPDGRWLTTTSAAALRDLRVVHRADLHRVLSGLLAPGTLRGGHDVRSVSADGTRVTFADTDNDTGSEAGAASTEKFDVVVAADGIRSTLRTGWPGDAGIRYSGYSAWRGVTSEPVDLGGAAGETWGAGLRFGMAPLRDGHVYWFAVASMPADQHIDDEHEHVESLFAGWHAPIDELIAATAPSRVQRLPIEDLARPLRTYRRGRCVLLGDAAHAMTPDLGQGGNQAMEDAATLTALLAPLAAADAPDDGRISSALETYDAVRRRRTQPIARRARMVGRVAQARGPVRVALRNALLRAVPDAVADRQLVAMQAWHPPST